MKKSNLSNNSTLKSDESVEVIKQNQNQNEESNSSE